MKELRNSIAGHGLTRRTLLASSVTVVGFGVLTALVRQIFNGKSRPTNLDPLPGPGSIFQPRRDQRLIDWLKQHPQNNI